MLIIIIIIIIILICYLLFKLFKTDNKIMILHIGKTAGRAIYNSIKNEPNIKKMDHKINAFDLDKSGCNIAAVIRDPLDRFISAIYWFKQGGENNDQINNKCSKFLKHKSIKEILQNPKQFESICEFNNNVAFRPTKSFIYGSEDKVIPLCFDDLNNEFNKKIKPYCKKKCELKNRNKSKRPKLQELSSEELNIATQYVNKVYKNDIIFYNKKCRNTK